MPASGTSSLSRKSHLRRWARYARSDVPYGTPALANTAPALQLGLSEQTAGSSRNVFSRLRLAVLVLVMALVLALQGCSLVGGEGARTGATGKGAKASHATGAKRAGKPADESGGYAALSDWEAFERTRRSLRGAIDRRAKALRGGAVGNLAAELASLRMSAKAPALIDKGSLDGAVELLERAVSMYGGNGYAYLFLAYVHHVEGRPDRAAGFLSSARRYLPADKGVRGEVEGLARSIRASGPSSDNTGRLPSSSG